MEELQLNRKEVKYKVDTGAEVTAMSDQTYHNDGNKFSLTPSQRICLAQLIQFWR